VDIALESELTELELDSLGWEEGQLMGYSSKVDRPLFAFVPSACDSAKRSVLPNRSPMANANPLYPQLSCLQKVVFSNRFNQSFVLTCQGELYAAENVQSLSLYQEKFDVVPPPEPWFYLLPTLRLSYEKEWSRVGRQNSPLSLDDFFYSNSHITIWMEWSLDEV
jgi:hypothetical protein